MAFTFSLPGQVFIGSDCLRKTEAALKELALKKANGPTTIPEDLCYLYGKYFEDYLADVEICQQFAKRNRELMAEIILDRCGLTAGDAFHTIHNYIDTKYMILRKGAISARLGERVIIPLNMRDGALLGTGNGNPEWNFSAPHGAGRACSRTEAKYAFTVEEFKREMEGIYTTTATEGSIDECPMAYKAPSRIFEFIGDTVSDYEIIKPIYNFKSC